MGNRGVVRNGLGIFTLVIMGIAAVEVGIRIFWIDLDRGAKI
jgi:hypothetical protein